VGAQARGGFPNGVSAAITDRHQAGHWEVDLALFRRSSDNVLIVHERAFRLTRIIRQPNHSSLTALPPADIRRR
jgi:IS30 family transposase